MFTLTIITADTDHKVVLAFTSFANAKTARDEIFTNEAYAPVEIEDDYGVTAMISRAIIRQVILTDVASRWEYDVIDKFNRVKAENDFNRRLAQDPSLQFLVDKTPMFRK